MFLKELHSAKGYQLLHVCPMEYVYTLWKARSCRKSWHL